MHYESVFSRQYSMSFSGVGRQVSSRFNAGAQKLVEIRIHLYGSEDAYLRDALWK